MSPVVYVLNGPNLNLLGTRQPEIYGRETLADVEAECRRRGADLGLAIEFRQTNAEFQLIDWIHESRLRAAGIIINPAAFSHTSVAVLDALNTCEFPILEVHISNIHQREEFRHHSFVSRVAAGVICGFGTQGYALAIERFARLIGSSHPVASPNRGRVPGRLDRRRYPGLTLSCPARARGCCSGPALHVSIDRPYDPRAWRRSVGRTHHRGTANGFCGTQHYPPIQAIGDTSSRRFVGRCACAWAVNTVVLKDGKRIGHNTDWFGFAENFRRGLPDAPRDHVVQLGAGGAGSAVAHAALTCGVKKLTIVDTVAERARAVAVGRAARFGPERVSVASPAEIASALATADGLINTTPIGMAKYPGLPLCLRPCCARTSGWPRSFISLWRPNFCAPRVLWAAVRWMGAG